MAITDGDTIIKSLDHIDRGIIALLNQNGRMSSAEIARRLGNIPSRTINYRIEALIQQGIISVRAIVNPHRVGYDVLADVLLEVEAGHLRAVAEQVAGFDQVSYLCSLFYWRPRCERSGIGS